MHFYHKSELAGLKFSSVPQEREFFIFLLVLGQWIFGEFFLVCHGILVGIFLGYFVEGVFCPCFVDWFVLLFFPKIKFENLNTSQQPHMRYPFIL